MSKLAIILMAISLLGCTDSIRFGSRVKVTNGMFADCIGRVTDSYRLTFVTHYYVKALQCPTGFSSGQFFTSSELEVLK